MQEHHEEAAHLSKTVSNGDRNRADDMATEHRAEVFSNFERRQ